MALTGHRSVATVLKHYREVPQRDLEEAVKAIDKDSELHAGQQRSDQG